MTCFWLVSYQPPVQLMQTWMEHGVFFSAWIQGSMPGTFQAPMGIDVLLGKPSRTNLHSMSQKSVQRLHSCLGSLMWLFFVVSMFGLQMRGSYASLTKDLMDLDLAGFKMNTGPFPDMLLQRAFQVPERWSLACLGAVRSFFLLLLGFMGGSSASWRFLFWSEGFNIGIRIK